MVVLDLHIPDLPGVEVLRKMGEAELHCKTIVLSGEKELSSVAPILNLGALDYLAKPFEPNQLLKSVSNAISRYALERENARMQTEANENAKLYEFLLNASPDLVYMLDPAGNFQFANSQLSSLFAHDSHTLIGESWDTLFADDTALCEQLKNRINERRTGLRATTREEFEYVSALGTKHALELSAIGLYEKEDGRQGDFIGSYGVIRDITEAKQTRQQLQQSQRKFYSLFVDSPDAVFISEIETGRIMERNPQFMALRASVGASDETNDHFLWDDAETRQAFISALEQTPNLLEWNIETEFATGTHYFEIRARHLELEGDPCLIATVRDRTLDRKAELDRLAIQRQLQQASRMEAIGQVAGGIAHDFNNILASIIGYAELVMNVRERLDGEKIDKYLEEVVTAGHRAKDLISQMLTFTKAQRGDTQTIDVTQTISDVSRMLRAAIPASIELDTRFDEDLYPVAIDPVQLQQIIINLLINARDAISGTGNITVSAYNTNVEYTCDSCGKSISGERVAIDVQDTGHGIPDDILTQIFEMYFTTRAPETGTGFGLWVVNNLVHEHHGHITVKTQVGEGTCFTIHLPKETETAVSSAIPSVPVPRTHGRIVVVDDEVSVANFIGEVLRDRGYPTVVFTESPKALEYLQNNIEHVSLLLTDGSMPLISGLELAEFAKREVPDLPIVFITAYSQHERELEQLGVERFLRKPFRIDEMIETVRELIEEEVEAEH